MASPTPPSPNPPVNKPGAYDTSLRNRLAAVLPQGHRFGIHHVSTPPTRTEPLCPAPPGERPDKTYRESHFLAVSIHPNAPTISLKRASPGTDDIKQPPPRLPLLAFAIEVFIFTTAYQTILFVSKTDSTGYLHLLGLPKGAPSPIRQVCATFLAYLLDHRKRPNVQSIVNLFARAQDQYLFPGSIRNAGKHVLDDWGLVRWWCRVLNPLMEGLSCEKWANTKGYLIVPGLEETETRSFLPRTPSSLVNWTVGHPLEKISRYVRDFGRVPPRCLIPGYPDDPKSRFRDELDEEVSPRKHSIGAWKSVKTLDQFWEMMAFRQECSSGRLTGFIWLVFDSAASADVHPQPQPLPESSSAAKYKARRKKKKKLSGPIKPREPRIKTVLRNGLLDRPTLTAYYYWPSEGRGDRVVDEAEYKRIIELLLHLDFSTLDKALGSSRRWIHELGAPEVEVIGRATAPEKTEIHAAGITNLTGLVRRMNSKPSDAQLQPRVNVLGANLVRKKKKEESASSS
ncbi:putative regulator of ty1 transposition protein [Thermochaetoides thermophila DSM 1495]|uniref:histone acetyltransferase n=1 Tax=Chaetomium thermophilum (strain DSM 1495 / CBS 144.50 / IMI 039719) TaxID=759272 RepID=G0SCV1_CHATD|nr:putative regulator of ty1 transposition protein [Thermochaetoides thermophila DSM 1495]EGS18434.1 putative regulator of ty1 transposition protein [Thermochaetoides thermophila DSM 1495]